MSRSDNRRRFGCGPARLAWSLALLLIAGCAAPPGRPPTPRPPASHPADNAPRPRPYRVDNQWYYPLASARGFEQRGKASWYGRKFHGRPTASGEIYDMYAETAAHKTLPLGTHVRVRNLENGRSMELRVNDRGPFVRGRIIDLSYTAARQLGVVGPGTAEVVVTAIGSPAGADGTWVPVDYYHGKFTFQVGAFKDRRNAERLVARLDAVYHNAHLTTHHSGGDTFYRVRVGRTASLEEAESFEKRLIESGFPGAFIIAE